jgi:Arc/MetJ-type ribon-helix-helix transcriptional regulator
MKLSLSLAEKDVEFLDSYAETHGIPSRSATVQRAVRLLRSSELEAAYEDAFTEWEASGEAALWDSTVGDGIDDDIDGAA